MDDIVELGGNIVLEGFSDLERSKLVVVKKIVGNYAKVLEEEKKMNYKKLIVAMAKEGDNYKINITLKEKENEQKAEMVDKNLFIALDSAFNKIVA